MKMWEVICDHTNNSEESINQGILKADITIRDPILIQRLIDDGYIKPPSTILKFILNKDGSIRYDN
jgi:hypothetical protein